MIKQNVKPTKKERSLRSAMGKFAPLFNHMKKVEADLREAGEPGLAQCAIQVFHDIEALEKMIMQTHKEAQTS